jgi:hypothetical protein
MSAVRIRKFRTACDRCYELKERCVRGVAAACTRCQRLDFVCSTNRPVRPTGRRPRLSKSESSADMGISLRQKLHDELSPKERDLMTFLLDRPESLEYLVVASSFQIAQQRSLTASLSSSFPLLKDAYLACADALFSLHTGRSTNEIKFSSLGHASSAMRILRSLSVTTTQDAALCLSIGAALSLYVYSAVGDGIAHISHYCISASSPYMETGSVDEAMDSNYSFLVLLQIMECLVHRREPTRISLSRLSERVDRHLGLCLPLLPLYHDLCAASYTLANDGNTNCLARVHQKLDQIEAAVGNWVPSCLPQIGEHFSSVEMVDLLAQARVYRLAALLVSHRLRHVFGSEDDKADLLSKEIMMELRLAKTMTKEPLRCVTLPFIIAAIEVRDTDTRLKTLCAVDDYVDKFAPVIQKATKMFLTRVWHEREAKMISCWFDSVHKPCVVLDAIDSACLA